MLGIKAIGWSYFSSLAILFVSMSVLSVIGTLIPCVFGEQKGGGKMKKKVIQIISILVLQVPGILSNVLANALPT